MANPCFALLQNCPCPILLWEGKGKQRQQPEITFWSTLAGGEKVDGRHFVGIISVFPDHPGRVTTRRRHLVFSHFFWHSRSPQASNALQRDSDALYLRQVCPYRQATCYRLQTTPYRLQAALHDAMQNPRWCSLPSRILSASKHIPRRRLKRAGTMWTVASNNRESDHAVAQLSRAWWSSRRACLLGWRLHFIFYTGWSVGQEQVLIRSTLNPRR